MPRRECFDSIVARRFVAEGSQNTLNVSVVPWLQREGMKIVLLRSSGADVAGLYAILMQLTTILGGFVTMFTAPLYAAIGNRVAAKDHRWNAIALKRSVIIGGAYSLVTAASLVYFGSAIFGWWMQQPNLFTQSQLGLFGVYFALAVISHLLYVFTVAGRYVTKLYLLAIIQMAFGVAVIYFVWPLSLTGSLLALIAANGICVVCLAWFSSVCAESNSIAKLCGKAI
jgi:O-antigen/teichoic acid export membrane protein